MELAGLQASGVDTASSHKMLSPVLRVSLLLGVCVHLAGFLIFRVKSNPLPSREESAPFVQFVSPETLVSGAELEEQAALFDSAPLFIPSEWNAAHNLQAPRRDRAMQRFPLYQPEMNVAAELVPEGTSLGASYTVVEAEGLLASRFWNLFRGFERGDSAPVDLGGSGVFAEVRSLDGRIIQNQPAKIEFVSNQTLQPAKYFLRVEAGGRLSGRPTLAGGSGDAEFDAAAYDWLIESGLASSLESGYFEIIIYP